MTVQKRGIEHVWRHTIKFASPRPSILTDDVRPEDDNNDDDDDHDDADDAQENDDKDDDNNDNNNDDDCSGKFGQHGRSEHQRKFSGQTLTRTVGRNTFEKMREATPALLPTDWTSQSRKWLQRKTGATRSVGAPAELVGSNTSAHRRTEPFRKDARSINGSASNALDQTST